MDRISEDEFLCYGITSISSYSVLNEYIRYGHNRDREKLPQLNLAMLFGQKSSLPAYYHRIPGNLTDVHTMHNLLETFKKLEVKSLLYVLDKGIYSRKNVDELLERRDHFLISVPLINRWVRDAIDRIIGTVHDPEGYRMVDDEAIYIHSRLYPWGEGQRRCFLHLDIYDTYFVSTMTPVRGKKISYNTEAVNQSVSCRAGFQALLTTKFKESLETLQVNRDKDVVEKCLDDPKNTLDMKRLRMHSIEKVDGRLFVQLIALILMSELRRAMRESKLIARYTVRELLLEMDPLTRIHDEGKYGLILT